MHMFQTYLLPNCLPRQSYRVLLWLNPRNYWTVYHCSYFWQFILHLASPCVVFVFVPTTMKSHTLNVLLGSLELGVRDELGGARQRLGSD